MTSNTILPASAVDRRLLRGAAKYMTPTELSDSVLGQLTPAQAQARVLEILDSKTILDEVQERRMLLIRMSEHLDWIQQQKHDPKSWGAIAKQFKLVSDQIERANISLTDVSTKLASEQAVYFMDSVVIGLEKILGALSTKGVDVEEEEVVELMQVGSEAAHEYLEKVTQAAEVEA